MVPPQSTHHWLESPLGASVLAREAVLLQDAMADVFGFEMLQVGSWGPAGQLVTGSRTQHRCWIAPDASGPGAIRAELDRLPIASASVEAVLLPHTLEFASNPHELLREVERVMVGEGQLLVCGFNPRGPWGLRHLVSRGRFPPSGARLMSETRVRDWLRLLGFEVANAQRYFFAPPWAQVLPERSRAWLERRGPVLAPPLAGAYLLKARKRSLALTPIRPARARRPVVVVTAPEPTSRNAA
ncbi:MAG TPA: methyltransferase domain-containing protein [Steroidobacteraceae bacterium]